ncbi:protein kinase superfamily protein [Carex rostrata]
MAAIKLHLLLPLLLFFTVSLQINAQQEYENNKQLDCYATNASTTLGYACNGALQCSSYLTFRSSSPYYQSPVQISFLFNASTANVSSINSVPDVVPIPDNDLVLVPIPCSCSGQYYQHNATYTLKFNSETYFSVANNTYQGLSTCQSLIAQNPYISTNLSVGLNILVPVRCACPTANQTAAGVKYLLNYLITWGDTISAIASRFGISEKSLLDANKLTSTSTIYPFTTLLVPLLTEPTKNEIASPPPPPSTSTPPPPPPPAGNSSSKTWVYVGVGVGVGVVALVGLFAFVLCCFWRRRKGPTKKFTEEPVSSEAMLQSGDMTDVKSGVSISGDIRTMIESLTLYKFEELDRATDNFSDNRRINGSSVYSGTINGDEAAIRRLKGDVSNEINILKQINHSSIIRLSGFCIHAGNTYLVYQYAGNGSLSEWIHGRRLDPVSGGPYCLSWKHRMQVAYDVADGLNYLHNYTKPPYVHKNLNSQNVLLDRDFRAKLSNFSLARAVNEEVFIGESGVQPQLTRHVVGTQGYMSPEYLEHGLIMTQLDVFAFGVLLLELLSGKEPVISSEEENDKECEDVKQPRLLSEMISSVLSGENVRSKLSEFIDPCLQSDYPFELAFAIAELAMRCLAREPGLRPGMGEVMVSLSGIYNSTFDWDPSDYGKSSGSTTIDAR